jgi:ABC-type sulfate transport system permease component
VNHFIVVVGVVVAKLLNVLIEDEFIGAWQGYIVIYSSSDMISCWSYTIVTSTTTTIIAVVGIQ